MKAKNKIIVAMSGGVDSSVAAALLKKQVACPELGRRDVVGVFMRFWKDGKSSDNRCCSIESENLARAAAKKIGIPFYVINVEKEFKKKVVDYFLKEYKKGNTPNPCVVCNKEIKFGFLIKKALALGAGYIATGHYVNISLSKKLFSAKEVPLSAARGGVDPKLRKVSLLRLLRAKDDNKDQSYFLWQLNQKQLSKVLFPVGNYTKPEVRKLAKKFKLPTAQTPESQEVCFIQNTTNDFLKKYIKVKPGDIVAASPGEPRPTGRDKSGEKIGKHQGLWFYTIGQRKGIGLSGGPYYVIAKNFENNTLIVSKNQRDLLQKEITVKNVNWISVKKPKLPLKVQVKIRYRGKLSYALIRANKGGSTKIIFKKPQGAVTPGQSAVFYKGSGLLGGGVIQ